MIDSSGVEIVVNCKVEEIRRWSNRIVTPKTNREKDHIFLDSIV